MRKAIVLLLAALVLSNVFGLAMAGPSRPVVYFHNIVRQTQSGSWQIVSGTNGDVVRLCPAKADTTGQCKDCQWVGGPKSSWSAMPDSTFTFNLFETTGPDSAITGYQNMALFGPELIAPDSAVTSSALRPDPDAIFRPRMSFEFFPGETVKVSVIAPCDTCANVTIVGFSGGAGGDSSWVYAQAESLLVTVYAYIQDLYAAGITMDDGPIEGASLVETDSLTTVGIRTSRALVVGSAGSGDADINGSLTVTGLTTFQSTVSTTTNLNVGDRTGTDSLTVRGPLKTGTAGLVGDLSMSDGSSNIYQFTPPATAVNWDMPIAIRADTLLMKTTRTLMGDRVGSKYVQGLLATDLVLFAQSINGLPAAAQTVSMWAVNDSLCVKWISAYDNYTAGCVVFRK